MRQIERAIGISDRLTGWNMLESASGVLERVLESHPYNPEVLRRLGRIRLAQGLPHEAIPYLKLAIAHDDVLQPVRTRSSSPTLRRAVEGVPQSLRAR